MTFDDVIINHDPHLHDNTTRPLIVILPPTLPPGHSLHLDLTHRHTRPRLSPSSWHAYPLPAPKGFQHWFIDRFRIVVAKWRCSPRRPSVARPGRRGESGISSRGDGSTVDEGEGRRGAMSTYEISHQGIVCHGILRSATSSRDLRLVRGFVNGSTFGSVGRVTDR